ncbi:unnamed protein product [Ectocarpus sp. 4 AP-2014]
MLPFRATAILAVGFDVVHRRGCPRANVPLLAAAVLLVTQAPVSEPVGVLHLPAAGGARWWWWCSGRWTQCCRYLASSGPGTARLPRISGGGRALLCRFRYDRLCCCCRRRRWWWRRWRRRRVCCRWFAPRPVAQFAHRAPLVVSALLRRHSAWWVRGWWAAREGHATG